MKRPGDKSPDPPGGRAAERLREFEDARRPPEEREPDEPSEGGDLDKGGGPEKRNKLGAQSAPREEKPRGKARKKGKRGKG